MAPAHPAPRAIPDRLANAVPREPQARPGLKAPKGQRGLLAKPGKLASRAPGETRVQRVRWVHGDLLARMANADCRGIRENWVLKDHKDHKDHKVPRAPRDRKDRKDLRALKDRRVRRGKQVPRVWAEASLRPSGFRIRCC